MTPCSAASCPGCPAGTRGCSANCWPVGVRRPVGRMLRTGRWGRAMWLLYLPLVIPALAGMTARPLAARLEPRHATCLLPTAAVALAVCSMAALALLAAYAAAKLPFLAAAGGYSPAVMRRGDPISAVAGV